MKTWIGFLFSLLISAGSFAAPARAKFAKVEGGQIKPFWLESITKNSKNSDFTVASFEAMVYQVTVKDFKIFLDQNPRWRKENISSIMADNSYLENLNQSHNSANDLSPMTNVSWFAASAYCESLGQRLPTTTEWEFMAAASENQKDASGDAKFLARILEWYGQPQTTHLKNVGSIYKNLYGIWDLHGNVWEWVSDFNSNFITGESREDAALNKDMFCGAGGLAGGNKENYAAFMRYAFRSSLKGKSSTNNLGFRCVR